MNSSDLWDLWVRTGGSHKQVEVSPARTECAGNNMSLMTNKSGLELQKLAAHTENSKIGEVK